MSPKELSTYLLSIASYIEKTESPSRKDILAGLVKATKALEAGRVAGKVTKFVDRDYSAAMHGLEALIERLGKAAKTLNPQNESKATLEHSVAELQQLKAGLSEAFQSLSAVDI
jgi:hypothetical protein